MDDLTAVAGPQRLRVALSWLYDAIERGRIEPVELATELSYAFVGDRRSDDRVSIRADRDARLR